MAKYVKVEDLTRAIELLKSNAVEGYVNFDWLNDMLLIEDKILSFRINDIDKHIETLSKYREALKDIYNDNQTLKCDYCIEKRGCSGIGIRWCNYEIEDVVRIFKKTGFCKLLDISRPTLNDWICNMEEMGCDPFSSDTDIEYRRYEAIDAFRVLDILKRIKALQAKLIKS